jgi:hypothetical protein
VCGFEEEEGNSGRRGRKSYAKDAKKRRKEYQKLNTKFKAIF